MSTLGNLSSNVNILHHALIDRGWEGVLSVMRDDIGRWWENMFPLLVLVASLYICGSSSASLLPQESSVYMDVYSKFTCCCT